MIATYDPRYTSFVSAESIPVEPELSVSMAGTGMDAVHAFERRILALVDTGMTRRAAVKQINAEGGAADDESDDDNPMPELPSKPTNPGAEEGRSATARWNRLVEAKICSGMLKADAVRAVNRENPGLREKMVSETNAVRPRHQATNARTARPRVDGPAMQAWTADVNRRMERGLSRRDAIAASNRESPQLRLRMLAEANN